MNIILLSGGSGKRLWPLSNDVRSKQFIKLFKNNDVYESMVQRVYRQITTVDADASHGDESYIECEQKIEDGKVLSRLLS